MSEPRIAIKVVANHFVTCFPMPDPRPDEVTFPQGLRDYPLHRFSPFDPADWDYAKTKEDLNS